MTLVSPKVHSRALAGQFAIFSVVETHYSAAFRGVEREYDITTLEIPDWVTVVPITSQGDVVLIRQWRYGVEKLILETPGGVIDPGEGIAAAAARELAEETGYVAATLESLGSIYANPAIQNNQLHMMLAHDAQPRREPAPDDLESIETVVMSLAACRERLDAGDIAHALSALALERALSRVVGNHP